MSKSKQYRSPIMAAVHETAEDLSAAGLMDKCTMRKFDEACLTPVRKSALCARQKKPVRRCLPAV